MTPEERRRGAFEMFDELLAEGVAVDQAVLAAAEKNELKTDVFRAVAEKELGNLEEHARKAQLRAANASHYAQFLSALSIYIDRYQINEIESVAPPLYEWLEKELGRELTDDEKTVADERNFAAFNLTFSRDVTKLLKEKGIDGA